MDKEIEEWRRHLGLPVEIELTDPQGEKFTINMKPLTGEYLMDLISLGSNFSEDVEKNREMLTKREMVSKLAGLIATSLEVPEEVKEELASKYFLDLFPELFNLNFKSGKTTVLSESLSKQQSRIKRMEELRKNDGKSPKDTTGKEEE